MNKSQLIKQISQETKMDRDAVESFINKVFNTIIETLASGDKVTLSGFGTFSVKQRVSRIGVNPRNLSERIEIPALKTAKFKASKNLKQALRSEKKHPHGVEQSQISAEPEPESRSEEQSVG